MDCNSSSDFGHSIVPSHTFNPILEPDTLCHPPSTYPHNQQNLPLPTPLPKATLQKTDLPFQLSVGFWNVCGWSLDPSQQLKSNVITTSRLDIICIAETLILTNENEIHLKGYKWFGNNRRNISKRAIRGLGGVGILIKNSILSHFSVAVLEEKAEGILWIDLIGKKITARPALRYLCLLSPPN